MLAHQALQAVRLSARRTMAGDPIDHLIALLPGARPRGEAPPREDLREAEPVTLPHQCRAGD